jgi:integrase
MSNRGQGRIFQQRGSPYWYVAYYANKKEIREAAKHVRTGEKLEIGTEKNRREAERFLKDRLASVTEERRGGRAFIGPREDRVSVADLLDGLATDFRLRDKWNFKVASNMKPVRDYFGSWRAADLSSAAVGTWIERLREEGYSNSTVNHRTKLLRQAFKIGIRNRQISQQPFIPRLSEVGNERQGFFETAEFEAALPHLPEYLRDFCRFGFLTGWRKGSIESLRWADVGEDVIYLRAENSKTRKPETMPLEGELLEIIERRRAAAVLQADGAAPRFAEYVFHLDGNPVGDFRKAWASACVAAGLGKRTCPKCAAESSDRICEQCQAPTRYSGKIFQDFRRTASRNMIAAGVPQAVAMKITGHRTDSMFRRYCITDETMKREALAKTQQYLATSPARKVVAIGRG